MKQKKNCTCSSWTKWGMTCPDCSDSVPSKFAIPAIKNMVYLESYGMVSAARLDELNRRALITDKHGNEHLCRLGENGKIQQRLPDYY